MEMVAWMPSFINTSTGKKESFWRYFSRWSINELSNQGTIPLLRVLWTVSFTTESSIRPYHLYVSASIIPIILEFDMQKIAGSLDW